MLLVVLAARSLKRQSFGVKSLHIQRERSYRMSQRSAVRPSRVLRVSVAGGGALTATLMLGLGYSLYADPSPLEEPTPTPLSKLLTSYVVYSACSVPGLVEASPSLLAFCTSTPGLRQLTEALVRATFFEQVVLSFPRECDRGINFRRRRTHSLSGVRPHTNACH